MDLRIRTIEYSDFRTYDRFVLDGVGDLTLIVGPNAIGKTNLLEGIQLTTAMTSFRNPRADHLIRTGCSSCRVKSTVSDGSRVLDIELRVDESGKSYYLNGKKKRAHTLRGIVPSVMFCPDDLDLVKGSQGVKRAQLDQVGAQLSANYHAVRKDYERILRQKNRSLKEGVSPAYLGSVNEVLATVGAQLYRFRAQLTESLEPYIRDFYRELSGGRDEACISYIPSWERKSHDLERETHIDPLDKKDAEQRLMQYMEDHALDERDRRMALCGPHLDRVEFYLNGLNASLFASQGQQRSLVLGFKMAEVALMRDRLGQTPVLLLDDVMSELDDSRRAALMGLISGEVQTFITATNAERFDDSILGQARVICLGGGGHEQGI